VFTSNVFAILGLRSLYFLLAGAVERFALLKYGLALVLVFVGLKMVWLNDAFGGKFPIGWSLGIIGSVIAVSIVWSMLATRGATKNTLWKEDKEHEVVVENRHANWN
jgi:tellurite resistance protein TerC